VKYFSSPNKHGSKAKKKRNKFKKNIETWSILMEIMVKMINNNLNNLKEIELSKMYNSINLFGFRYKK
jgi:hypothetical protein